MLKDHFSMITSHNRVADNRIPVQFWSSSKSKMHFRNKKHLLASISCEHQCLSGVYLGGRPSRALFRHCGVLSVSAVERGTSGVSALESPSHSPSASPCRPSLSSPSASCHDKHTRHADIQIPTSDSERSLDRQVCEENRGRQHCSVHKVITGKKKSISSIVL